jgi:predicted transcriptional regulator of viral defense system
MIRLEKLNYLPYFTIQSVNQLTGGSMASTRLLLSRQEEAGKVFRIKRGCYMAREFWLQNKNDENFIALVSSIIQPHSYLTGAWVLQKYGVMTEGIYLVTAATLKHTRSISNKLAGFYYFHIKEKLFNGFVETSSNGIVCREATASKALFDFFYFRSEHPGIRDKNFDLAEDERLNLFDWDNKMKTEFFNLTEKSESPKMKRIAVNLQRKIWV